MALIECYECGKEISSMAAACPHCGAPAKIVYFENEDEIDIKGNIFRDVIIDGKKVKKWFGLKSITDFSSDGKPIHIVGSKGEIWYEYNDEGRKINERFGDERWEYKYNAKGFVAGKKGYNHEYEYKCDDKGQIVQEIFWGSKKEIIEYEYDEKGNIISEKKDYDITRYENNENGNPIHAVKKRGIIIDEWWAFYLYEYWANGNLKRQIEYRTLY